MLATLIFCALGVLAVLLVTGFVLLPLALMSGLWAGLGARGHREQARDIERLLAEDERRAQS